MADREGCWSEDPRQSREHEVIGLAQGPSRRKSQEVQELKPEAGDKARAEIKGPSRRKN